MKSLRVLIFISCLILLCASAYGAEQQAAQTPDAGKEQQKGKEAGNSETPPAVREGKEANVKNAPKSTGAGAEAETSLEEVIVTATRSEKTLDNVPGDSHVVTKKDIEKRNIKTIDEALSMTPGVYDRRGKGLLDTRADVSIRGVPSGSGYRTLIMKDGIPMNTAYNGGYDWVGAIGDVERIEVVEGPFSSLYGGNAMGGVINIITRMPEKSEFVSKTGYGSSWYRGTAMDDLWRSYVSYGNRIADKFSFFVSYGFQSTNGYPSDMATSSACPAGTTGCVRTTTTSGSTTYLVGDKGDNKWWDYSILVKAAYDFSKDTRLLVSYNRTRSKYDYDNPHTWLTNAAGVPVYRPREATYLSTFGGGEANLYTAVFDTLIGSSRAKLSLGINDIQKNWYSSPNTSAPYATINGGPGKLSESPSQNYYADLQFTIPLPLNNILTVGGTFRHGNLESKEYSLSNWRVESSTTALTLKAEGKDYNYALFIQDEIGIMKNLTAYLGVRGDLWMTSDGYMERVGVAGYPQNYDSRTEAAVSPKFALVYKPLDGTTLRASVGRSFRPPSLYELYRTWTMGSTEYKANPNLKPETMTSWDISIGQKLWQGAKAKVTYFENYFEDMIYRNALTSTNRILLNAGGAETKGFVGEVEQKIRWFRLFANATWLTVSKITENPAIPASVGKKITMQPDEIYNGGVDFTYGPFFANVNGSYIGKRYSNDTNNDVVNGVPGSYDPFFLLNAKISYTIMKHATVSFAVDNILDKRYYSSYLAPGRSWFTELTLKF